MDDLINNIKKKLSADNLVEMMKDAKVIDEKRIKEEDVRRTLEKIDPNNLIDVDELAAKLNEITEEAAKREIPHSKPPEKSMASVFTVLGKASEEKKSKENEDDYSHIIQDNVTGFLD